MNAASSHSRHNEFVGIDICLRARALVSMPVLLRRYFTRIGYITNYCPWLFFLFNSRALCLSFISRGNPFFPSLSLSCQDQSLGRELQLVNWTCSLSLLFVVVVLLLFFLTRYILKAIVQRALVHAYIESDFVTLIQRVYWPRILAFSCLWSLVCWEKLSGKTCVLRAFIATNEKLYVVIPMFRLIWSPHINELSK